MTANEVAAQAFGLLFTLGTGVSLWQLLGSWLVRLREAGEMS